MAITIRNKETEAMIRRIGSLRGEGPSAVIKRLAQEELKRTGTVADEELDRRMKLWDELAAKHPPPDDGLTWEDMEAEMQSLFAYLDEEVALDRRRA